MLIGSLTASHSDWIHIHFVSLLRYQSCWWCCCYHTQQPLLWVSLYFSWRVVLLHRCRQIIKRAGQLSSECEENQIISYTNVFSACWATCSSFKSFIGATICCQPWTGQKRGRGQEMKLHCSPLYLDFPSISNQSQSPFAPFTSNLTFLDPLIDVPPVNERPPSLTSGGSSCPEHVSNAVIPFIPLGKINTKMPIKRYRF